MAILTLSDLLTPQTEEQVRAHLYSTLSALGFSVTSWRPGGKARTMVAAVSRLFAALTTSIVEGPTRSGFLDLARADGLSILADQNFDVQREAATFATGFVTLTKPVGPIYTRNPDEVTFLASTTGRTYRNTEAFTFGAPSTSLTIPVRAVEVGSASTATPGQIDTLVTTLAGVTCSNASPVIGIDAEAAESLRARCKAKFRSLSPLGPADVYDYVARTSALNGGVHVTRTQVLGDSDFGTVTVYIADEDGGLAPGDVALVQGAIDRWAMPICTEPTVASASAVPVNVSIHVYVSTRAGLDDATATARGEAGLTAWFEAAPIGGIIIPPDPGKLFRVALLEALGRIYPEALKVDMSLPAADVVIGDGAVATLGAVTITLHQVTT